MIRLTPNEIHTLLTILWAKIYLFQIQSPFEKEFQK